MITKCRLTVRSYEIDSYGHVNNAHYLHYLEYARWHFLKDIGFDYDDMIKKGFAIYVARVEIDYKKSAFADDVLTIQTMPLKKGAVSGELQQLITREKTGSDADEIISSAKVTWGFVDKTGKPTRIPNEFNLPGLTPETN
jgi:acyl-CoA thioester hydrolase